MGKLFGTDGIRGIANQTPMTVEMALAIGQATAHVLKREHKGLNRILIGKDTRLSGYMIENALTAGICSMGVDAFLTGPMPTPGIAYITRSMRCVAGIVISASHNPYQDNGIKIFASSGFKLSDALEQEIEDVLASGPIRGIRPTAHEIGRARRIDDALGRYIEFCKGTYPAGETLEGMRIVLDCANGATYHVAPTIFRELGADVIAIHDEPDGLNINDRCGSQHTHDLCAKVRDTGAKIGLAFDGDGDRLIAVDESGSEISGDHIIAICARHLNHLGLLKNGLVILTPMSNLGLRLAFRDLGIRWMDAGVGDRLVLELMQREDATLGGEQSGHVIFRNLHTTGDGIVTALQLLAVMRRSGESLSRLATIFHPAPQRLINIDVREKPPIETLSAVAESIRKAEAELGEEGRVLVRYSGTQSMCRVMVESASAEATERLADAIANEVQKEIGIDRGQP